MELASKNTAILNKHRCKEAVMTRSPQSEQVRSSFRFIIAIELNKHILDACFLEDEGGKCREQIFQAAAVVLMFVTDSVGAKNLSPLQSSLIPGPSVDGRPCPSPCGRTEFDQIRSRRICPGGRREIVQPACSRVLLGVRRRDRACPE